MKKYEVLINIDLDKSRDNTLLIASSSFEVARKVAGKLLAENKELAKSQIRIMNIEEHKVICSYNAKGLKN